MRLLGLLSLLLSCALVAPALAQDPPGADSFSEGKPPIVKALGDERVVKLKAVNAVNGGQGRVVWFNFALAEAMGIELPRGNTLSKAYEAELLKHLAWRLLKPGESADGRRTVDAYADRYGGDGMGYNKGAGRAAFFGKYNLNIKGVGVTPLVSNRTHYSHRHGGAPLSEGVLEAVWGEVGTNLFNRGSTRILAVIDVGDHTTWEDGGKERRALIIRAGHQLRPAHILAEGFTGPKNYKALVEMFDATKTLVTTVDRNGKKVVDLKESLTKVADLHARTAAEMYRYRILHGGLSAGNKSTDAGMLDLGTITPQPRTAPVHVLEYKDYSGKVADWLRFESENERRIRDLENFKKVLAEGASGQPGVRWSDVDISKAYTDAYTKHVELQLLEASGLKPEAAAALRKANPELVREYATTLRALGRLQNEKVDMNIEKGKVERGSVVDIFNALRGLPEVHFGGGADAKQTLELLKADADDPRNLEKAKRYAERLAGLHKKVLEGAYTHGSGFYDGKQGFARSVKSRAEFENKPMSEMYRSELGKSLKSMIAEYEASGDPTKLRRAMEELIGNNNRDVENMLVNKARLTADGGLISGVEVREGVGYSVRSSAEGARVVRVELPMEAVSGVGWKFPTISAPNMSGSAAESIHYRYSFDGFQTHHEVKGTVGKGADGKPALLFEVKVEPGKIGSLEGAFHAREGNTWLNNGGRNYKGYRFAVPDKADLERLKGKVENPDLEGRGGPGFGPGFAPRRGAKGALQPLAAKPAELFTLFDRVKRVASGHTAKLGKAELAVELSNDVDARYDAEANRVKVTSGLVNAIEAEARKLPATERAAFRNKALALVMGHELAHGAGIKAERVADQFGLEAANKAVGPVSEAEARRALQALSSKGSVPLVERMKSLFKYGTSRGRAHALARAARGEADPYAKYRRADGTLEWKKLTRERALREGAGLAHFGLALFLKELAVVAHTGDRARIEEFFDGLMTTDFYKHYGLFVAGARVSEVAYVRYLQRYVKPRFINGVLKTNLVLATGLALPQLVDGTFNGKAFAISFGSLGISSAAVRATAGSIKWLIDLKKAKRASTAARVGAGVSRLAKVGGWLYTAGELAVVLYLAEEIERRVNAWRDLRAARAELADAGKAFFKALGSETDPKKLAAAADAYHQAWGDYRNFLYRPLLQDEAIYAARLAKAAKQAKLKADERKSVLTKLEDSPALRRNIERRYGSLEKYAERLTRKGEAAIMKDVATYTASFEKSRKEHLAEVYEGNKRGTPLLKGVDHLDWLLLGGQPGASGDPYGRRREVYARLGRERLSASLSDALKNASENRLESYDDEAAVLKAAIKALKARGNSRAAAELEKTLAQVSVTRAKDQELFQGKGTVDLKTKGAAGALEGR